MKIITQELEKKLPPQHPLLINDKINAQNSSQIIKKIKGQKKIEIYDLTFTRKCPNLMILQVKDHINRTGMNPLRKKQNQKTIDFLDITKLYNKNQQSIITDCCGNNLNTTYLYPSHYLCNVSIMAKHMGIEDISAFLVNIL